MMKELEIATGEHHSIIWIRPGLLKDIPKLMSERFPASRVLVITDEIVNGLYGEAVHFALSKAGVQSIKLVLPPGEKTKSFDFLLRVYDCLGENRFTRSDVVMALGGGVIGDLSGYAAATWQRGMRLVQVPTTLLAQIDSSIGGKTAIDSKWGKNMIGAFKQPDLVCIDPDVLKTLKQADFSAGMAEMIKYACIGDKTMFETLEKHSEDIYAYLPELIVSSCEMKKAVVEEDSLEKGKRMILNFGHTVAHVLEGMNEYEGLSHGFAVAIGMVTITRRSEESQMTEQGTANRIKELCIKYGLPVDMPNYDIRKAQDFLAGDKKARGNKMNIVLLKEIGSCYIHETDVDRAISFLGWRTE